MSFSLTPTSKLDFFLDRFLLQIENKSEQVLDGEQKKKKPHKIILKHNVRPLLRWAIITSDHRYFRPQLRQIYVTADHRHSEESLRQTFATLDYRDVGLSLHYSIATSDYPYVRPSSF